MADLNLSLDELVACVKPYLNGMALDISSDGCLEINLKVDGIAVYLKLSATCTGGCLILNIIDSTAEGLGVFGEVRRKAREAIVAQMAAYSEIVSVTNTPDANLSVEIVKFPISLDSLTMTDSAFNIQFSGKNQ